jgi:HAD superfamily hydrolase (TIGR01549 family)
MVGSSRGQAILAAVLRAVLFDVDFTLARPGPDLGPEGYRRLGERFGLRLDPERHRDARAAAVASLKRHPELEHDDEIWVAFTEDVIRGMGGEGSSVHECAVEMTRLWERSDHFELFDDALPVLGGLRRRGLLLGLVSNTGRDLDEFIAHHGLEVDVALSSRMHGKTKPDPTIFRAVLDRLRVEPTEAAMVGDSLEDDVAGAIAIGMQAFLIDREGVLGVGHALPDLLALPAALGLAP